MKKILLGVALSLLPYFAQAQLTVERNGQVKIDARKGGFNRGLRISTSADFAGSYGEDGTALLLENGSRLSPCATKIAFRSGTLPSTQVSGNLGTYYMSSPEHATFFVSTMAHGQFGERFLIRSNEDPNNPAVWFGMLTGLSGAPGTESLGSGLIVDNSSMGGQTTIRPSGSGWGFLGNSEHYWSDVYSNRSYTKEHPYVTSDERSKVDIENIPEGQALSKLSLLRPISYKLKGEVVASFPAPSSGYGKASASLSDKDTEAIARHREREAKHEARTQYGFVAQELRQIFPDLVDYDEETGLYSVQYTALIPLLVEGLQELKAENQRLQQSLYQIKTTPGTLRETKGQVMDTADPTELQYPVLYGNKPNPFADQTSIEYYLPPQAKEAYVGIFDMQGKMLKTLPCNERGQRAAVLLEADRMADGMYLYSLIVDDAEIDTKKMILKR